MRLAQDIREAVASREPTVVQYPAGTGKSYASASVLAEVARQGYRIAYSTQTHAVAHETRGLLPPDVRNRSVHVHSPLVQVGSEPVCARAAELSDRVFEFGVSLLGSVCPRCPHRESCDAYELAKARAKAIDDALIVFVSHAGIQQIFNDEKGDDTLLIVDEMPGTYEQVGLTRAQLKTFAEGGLYLPSIDIASMYLLKTVAAAWMKAEQPGQVVWGPDSDSVGDARELCQDWGRLRLREGAQPKADERALLKAGDALIRLCAHEAAGGTVYGVHPGSLDDVEAMLPDAAHEALVRRSGVLLSATPMLAALPGFKLRSCEVQDGAKVTRKMILSSDRGSGALLQNFYDDAQGRRVRRAREAGEEPGVPWSAVDAALERALAEADQYECKRVLFVTFKEIADLLRACPERLKGRVEVAHFGALRGLNLWMEGKPEECSVVYLFGTPRFAILNTIYQLGLTGEAADQAWIEYAAGELTQAEGRLRLPRRTKPCSVLVEGDVAPLTWHTGNVDEILELPPVSNAAGVWEAALALRSRADLAAVMGAAFNVHQPGQYVPSAEQFEQLKTLACPGITEGLRLLARMNAGRRRAWEETFSMAPLDED